MRTIDFNPRGTRYPTKAWDPVDAPETPEEVEAHRAALAAMDDTALGRHLTDLSNAWTISNNPDMGAEHFTFEERHAIVRLLALCYDEVAVR